MDLKSRFFGYWVGAQRRKRSITKPSPATSDPADPNTFPVAGQGREAGPHGGQKGVHAGMPVQHEELVDNEERDPSVVQARRAF